MKISRSLLPAIYLVLSSWLVVFAQEDLSALYYSGNYQEVIEASAAQIAGGDTSFNTFYLKALSEAQLGQSPEAIETLELALSLHPRDRRISRMLAGQYFDAGDYPRARDGYNELVAGDSTDVSSWLKLAEMASFRQQYNEAISCAYTAIELNPDDHYPYNVLGAIYVKQGEAEMAYKSFQKALQALRFV